MTSDHPDVRSTFHGGAAMLRKAQFDERTITGVVVPFEWDEDDEELVFAVVVLTD